MNWDDLRIVIAINRARSFARAARELGVDETTISRRLTRIEHALGVTLFDAVDGKRVPTERGNAILRHASDAEKAAQAIEFSARGQKAPPRHLRLSATASVAEHVLAPGLSALLSESPELTLTLDSTNEIADFSRWEADMAIRLGRPDKGDFTMRKLGSLRYCLVRPAVEYPDRLPVCTYPDGLSESPEMQALQDLFPGNIRQLKTGNLGVMRSYLASGQAIGVLPDYLAMAMQGDPAIRVTKLDVRRDAWLLMQTHLRNAPATRKVADWIISRFSAVADR